MTSTSDALPLSAIVLAAGEGSRMRSERPKPLHRLCGKPMLVYVLESLVDVPVAAYQVTGEYAMLEAAAAQGWLDRRRCVLEALTSVRRAGASIVVTYHALEVAGWL